MNIAAIRRSVLCVVASAIIGLCATTPGYATTNIVPKRAVAAQSAGSIQLTFDRIGYEWWGRPFFMDNSTRTDCYTNIGRRMLMLSVGVRIKNNTRVAMTPESWNIMFSNNKGRRASWCFVLDPTQPLAGDTAAHILTVAPGATVAFAAQVFVEPNERVKNAYVIDMKLGRSNTVTIPAQAKTPDM